MRTLLREYMRRIGERAQLFFPLAGQDLNGRVAGLRVDSDRLRLHEAIDITTTVSGVITTSNGSASATLAAGSRFVRLIATEDCYIRFGVGVGPAGDPGTDGVSVYLPAGLVEYLICPDPALTYTIAAIQVSAGGSLHWAAVR